jgi:2-phospho-L-lactate guanylyltransferase
VSNWSVIVPAKRLAVAKTRLRPATAELGAHEDLAHEDLVLALLADTVAAALACRAVGTVLVVTDDPAAAEVVRALGARTVPDAPDRGLNPALEHGARAVGGRAVAALSSDLPALRPADLAEALAAALATALATDQAAPRCFVADATGTGTTLLTAVGADLEPHFGPDSAQAHRASGAIELTGPWPGLTRDVDTAADLRTALTLGTGPRTTALAVRLGAAP